MPLNTSSFPEEVQVAFFVFGLLSDRWDGMSGTYLGKDWSSCEYIFQLHEIEDRKTIFFFMKIWEAIVMKQRAEDAEKKRKAAERKAENSAGGKTYTHNVRG